MGVQGQDTGTGPQYFFSPDTDELHMVVSVPSGGHRKGCPAGEHEPLHHACWLHGGAVIRVRLDSRAGLVGEIARLQDNVAWLSQALRLARQYVAATHGVVAGAVGSDNLVSPDLAVIDAALARVRDPS